MRVGGVAHRYHLGRRRRPQRSRSSTRPGCRTSSSSLRLRSAGRRRARPSAAMQVRGAPLIGITAAYGAVPGAARRTPRTPPWRRPVQGVAGHAPHRGESALGARRDARDPARRCRAPSARRAAYAQGGGARGRGRRRLCRAIGEHGFAAHRAGHRTQSRPVDAPVNVLTHCNAGWLGCRGLGHGAGARSTWPSSAAWTVHVWVDETRPRNQGASAHRLGAAASTACRTP